MATISEVDIESDAYRRAFKEAINQAFDNYTASGDNWFSSISKGILLLGTKKEVDSKVIQSAIQKGLSDGTSDISEDISGAINGSSSNLSIDFDTLDKTMMSKISDISGMTLDKMQSVYNMMGDIDQKYFASVTGHQETLSNMKKAYGGIVLLGDEAGGSLATSMEESYKTFVENFGKTNAELRAEGLEELAFDPQFKGIDAFADQMNFIRQIVEDPADAFRTFNTIVAETAKTYGEEIAGSLGDSADQIFIFGEGLQLESSQIQKILTRNIDRTGEASMETLKEFNRFAQSASSATGKSAKLIADNMADIITDVQNFGNVTDEEASRIAASLLEIGVASQTLGTLVGKFSDFDTAASAVGNLTAAFGLNLDAMEMMMLANEDQEQFLLSMRESFEEQGLAFEDMTLAEQKLLSQQLGIGIEEAARLFDFDNQITSMEDLQSATEEMTPEEAFTKMSSEIATLTDKGKSLKTAIDNTNSFGLGGAAMEDAIALKEATKQIQLEFGNIQEKAQSTLTEKLFDGAIAGTDGAIAKVEQLKSKIQSIVKSTESAQSVINDARVTMDTESVKQAGIIMADPLKKAALGIGQNIKKGMNSVPGNVTASSSTLENADGTSVSRIGP